MIFWNIIIGIAAFALQLILTPKPQNAKPAALEDFDAPIAEEGVEIPVVFGTDWLSSPNCTWYGDLKIREIKGARRYGFFGPRQVIGHKYSLGMQMSLCHGPADALLEIWIGDKLAWDIGTTGGRIVIDEPDLFGGDDREGGIVGNIDVCMGAPWQAQNDYLAGILGATLSAFRSVVTIVLRQVYIGTNTYIKPWQFRLKRIHLKSDGTEQWYDAKAAIPEPGTNVGTLGAVFSTGYTENDEGQLDTYGRYAVRADNSVYGGTFQVWHIPDGAQQNGTYGGASILGGRTHLTRFGEVVLRSGGDNYGHEPTHLEFRDVTNVATVLQDINLQTIQDDLPGVTLVIDCGFYMDEIEVGGEVYATAVVPNGFGLSPFIILHRSGGGWGVFSYYECGNNVVSISMGPTYTYGRINDSTPRVFRYTWNGGFAEDLITLPGFPSGKVWTCHYFAPTNEVVVVATTGMLYVYNEDLTTLMRSMYLGGVPGAHNSKRMTDGDSVIVTTGQHPISYIHWVRVSDLTIVRTIEAATSNFVHSNDNTPHDWFIYNAQMGGALVGGHFLYNMWWPLAMDALDMNPSHIIRECLTDKTWGMGYNASDIDDVSFTYAADVFYAEYFGLTLKWATESPIEDFIQMVQSHVDAYLYTSRTTGKFVLKPIRNDYVLASLPSFVEDDIIEWEEVSRRQPADANTSVTVKYTDRKNRGKQASHTFHNDAQVQQSGGVVLATRNYAGISRGDLAARVAQRDQKSLSAGMISGRIKCKRIVEGLNPGDPFRLTSIRHNLDGEVMRVAEITYAGGRTNTITIQFVQDVFNLGAEALIDTSPGDWENPANPPSAVDPRLVWEMPYRELTQMIGPADATTLLTADPDAGVLQMSGGQPTPDAMDAIIYVDNTTQEIMTFAPTGLLAADIGAFDTAITITDDTDITLISDGMLAAIAGTTPATTEIIRIDSRVGNDLTVSRGMVDSVPRIHAEGAALIVFDDAGMSDFEQRTAGQTPDVQLATRTPTGVLSLAVAPVDEITMDSRAIRPLRPANIEVEGFVEGPVDGTALSDFTTTWSERNRLTELGTALEWTDATVAAEAGQTTIIEVLNAAGTTVIATHAGLTGTSYDVPLASFGSQLAGWIRVGAERDGYREWQAYAIQVIIALGEAIGTAFGTSTAIAYGPPELQFADGFAAGSSEVLGYSPVTSTAVGAAAGIGTVSGVGGIVGALAYVNSGADSSTSGTATTSTPALPGSRVNGNLLVAVISCRLSNTPVTSSTGWTKWGQSVASSGGAALTTAIFYAFVDGAEVAPVITWGSGGPYSARVVQYTGVLQFSPPFGANRVATGTASPAAVNSIDTTALDSLLLYIIGSRNSTSGVDTPSGWTEDWDPALDTRSTGGHKAGGPSGTASGNISVTSPSTWNAWQIELYPLATLRDTVGSAAGTSTTVAVSTILTSLSPTGAWSASRDLVASFAGSPRYTIDTGVDSFKDQSGSTRDLLQATDAEQPVIVTAGPNSRNALDFDGVDMKLSSAVDMSNFVTNTTGYMIASFIPDAIIASDVDSYKTHPLLVDSLQYMGLYVDNSAGAPPIPDTLHAYNWDGSQDNASVAAVVANMVHVAEWKHESGNIYARLNGGAWSAATASGTTSVMTGLLKMGSNAGVSFNHKLFEAATFSTIPSSGVQDAIAADFMNWVGAPRLTVFDPRPLVSSTSNASSYSFSAADIGAAHADRIVAVAVAMSSTGGGPNTFTCTIGGIAATVVQTWVGVNHSGIAYAAVPTGATATIVITPSATGARCAIKPYRIIPASSTPVDSGTVTGSGAGTFAVTDVAVEAGGALIVVTSTGSGAVTIAPSYNGTDTPVESENALLESATQYEFWSCRITETNATRDPGVTVNSGAAAIVAMSWH